MKFPDKLRSHLNTLFTDSMVNELEQSGDLAPVYSIRHNPRKPKAQIPTLSRIAWADDAWYVERSKPFSYDPAWHAGAYYVQESSSIFLEYVCKQLFKDSGPLRILDVCASPGGKSLILADTMPEGSLLISNETIKGRVQALYENHCRWGRTNAWISHNDPAAFRKIKNYFDVLVIDAPCSGEGMFRKDPDAIQYWSDELVQTCVHRQERITDDVIQALKPGGFLIYSTCTFNRYENEDQITRLCELYGLEPVNIAIPSEWNLQTHLLRSVPESIQKACFRFLFHQQQGEGLFMAILQKPKSENGHSNHDKYERKNKRTNSQLPKHIPWMPVSGDWHYLEHQEYVKIISAYHYSDLEYLKKALYFIKVGTTLNEVKTGRPHHELALQSDLPIELPTCPLSENEALTFLRKGELSETRAQLGWQIATFEQQRLGWFKQLPQRINNYLPAEFRLLKQD